MSARRIPVEERFWTKVEKHDEDCDCCEGCWVWTGAKIPTGYGAISAHGRSQVGAHRVSYELLVGPIPEGLQLDHLCRNRACVNPAHLEAVTQRENVLRGTGVTAVNARKTHCKRGHEFTPQNTRAMFTPHGPGRACRACDRLYDANRLTINRSDPLSLDESARVGAQRRG